MNIFCVRKEDAFCDITRGIRKYVKKIKKTVDPD